MPNFRDLIIIENMISAQEDAIRNLEKDIELTKGHLEDPDLHPMTREHLSDVLTGEEEKLSRQKAALERDKAKFKVIKDQLIR